ncbi:MAG: hypothetical protein JNM91_14795, partial [Flavobacteriales bacterium]|nr:hypothetical protein [Flavobacteriales bacterium]
MSRSLYLLLPCAVLLATCSGDPEKKTTADGTAATHGPLLTAVPAGESGVAFNNTITASP